MSKLSVIILNFNRPEYIKDYILPALINCPSINEIIISHGKKETFFEDSATDINPKINNEDEWIKIKHLKHWGNDNKIYGLTLRFFKLL